MRCFTGRRVFAFALLLLVGLPLGWFLPVVVPVGRAGDAMTECLEHKKGWPNAFEVCRELIEAEVYEGSLEDGRSYGPYLYGPTWSIEGCPPRRGRLKVEVKRIWTYSESGVTPDTRPPMQEGDECYFGWDAPRWSSWLVDHPDWEEVGMGSVPHFGPLGWTVRGYGVRGGEWIYMVVRRVR